MEAAVADVQDDFDGDLFDGGGAQLTDHRAERLLVGCLITTPALVTECIEILRPHDLHEPLHRRVYELLIRSWDIGEPPTFAQLVEKIGASSGKELASIAAVADPRADVAEIADHLATLAERRAVGSADDDYIEGEPLTSKFGAVRWEDIGAEHGTVGYAWFVEDVVPMGEITLAFGDSGTGKSFDMFDMAMAGARGTKWNGRNVEPGLVVYIAAEAGKGFAKRKVAYALQHQLEPTEPLPFVLLTRRPNLFADDSDAVALIAEIKEIKRRYRQRLVLVVADTLSAAAPGMNENASQDVSMVRKRLVMMQDAFPEAAFVLVHHKPKNGSTPRGHGSLTADFETTIEFETVQDKKTDTGKTIHRGTVRKQREGKSGIYWEFTLPQIEVGRNKWGNPETSCYVEPYAVGTPKAPQVGFHATPTEKLFLRALYDALIDHGLPPPVGLPKSVTKVVEHSNVRKLMRERVIPPHEDSSIADGRFRTAYSRAGAKLRDGGVIGVQGNLLWPTGKPVIGFNETGG